MKYVHVPSELPISEIRASEACFSPSRYVRFIPPNISTASWFAPLDKLIVLRNSQIAINKGNWYHHAEIGDIDVTTGGVSFHKMRGYQLPDKRLLEAKNGDVLISTVRTYRKGIGIVSSDLPDLVTTKAIMNICGVTDYAPNLTLAYVYSFLRSDFFVEQVWSLLNRGVYPRMDKGALNKIKIPIASDPNVILYVTALVQAIVEKEKTIRARHQNILSATDCELSDNQNGSVFHYAYPSNRDIKTSSRLDTGLYCYGFRKFKHRVDSYRFGSTCLSEMGIKSRRGPNLAVSVMGKSLYSDEPKPNWYQLIRPVNIGEYGTLTKQEWLGTRKKLPVSNVGDLILGCEGFEKGRSIVLLENMERCTTNFHGTTLYSPTLDTTKIVFVRCFLAYLREHGVIDWVGVGGSGGHMSPEYFDYLPFPKFPDHKQAKIARLYRNPVPPPAEKPTLDTFVDWHRRWNGNLGIWELDREMKDLQRALADVQEKIIEGKTVQVPL